MAGNTSKENDAKASAESSADVQAELERLRKEIELKDRLLEEAAARESRVQEQAPLTAEVTQFPNFVGTQKPKFVERVVLTHGYDYVLYDTFDGKVAGHALAVRGQTVTVTEEKARKGERDGALGTQTDLNRLVAQETGTPNVRALEDLDELEVIAWLHVNQSAAQLAQVEEIEQRRQGGPRKAVLETVAAIRLNKDGTELEEDLTDLGRI